MKKFTFGTRCFSITIKVKKCPTSQVTKGICTVFGDDSSPESRICRESFWWEGSALGSVALLKILSSQPDKLKATIEEKHPKLANREGVHF